MPFMDTKAGWKDFVRMSGVPLAGDYDPDEASRFVSRSQDLGLLRRFETSTNVSEVAMHCDRVFHASVAAKLASRGDTASLIKLRERLRSRSVAAKWSEVVGPAAIAAARNDHSEVLETLKTVPTEHLAETAALAGATSSCLYMLRNCKEQQRDKFEACIANRLEPRGIMAMEASMGKRFGDLNTSIYTAIACGRHDTAIWYATSGRKRWTGMLMYLMEAACKGDGSLDSVRLAVASGCPYSDHDFPHPLSLKGNEAEARAISELAAESGRPPPVDLMSTLMRRGMTLVLDALYNRAGLLPPAEAIGKALGGMRVETLRWLETARARLDPAAYGERAAYCMMQEDNLQAFAHLHESGFFGSVPSMAEMAVCAGARLIQEYLRSKGVLPDIDLVLRKLESAADPNPRLRCALEWIFKNVPSGDDDYESIKRCMSAARNVARRTSAFRPFNADVVQRRVSALCFRFIAEGSAAAGGEVERLCDDLNIARRKGHGFYNSVFLIGERFLA